MHPKTVLQYKTFVGNGKDCCVGAELGQLMPTPTELAPRRVAWERRRSRLRKMDGKVDSPRPEQQQPKAVGPADNS